MISGNFGALGGVDGKAFDYEGRRWERFFVGEFAEAKEVMARLDAEQIPNRLAIPEGLPTSMSVVVEVRHRRLPEARALIASPRVSHEPDHEDDQPESERRDT